MRMGAALSIRGDMPAEELRRLARLERDGRVACRLMALANALDGMSRERAAHQAGMDRQTLRDWVIRFNAAGIDGLRDRPRSGRPPFLDEGQMAALKAIVLRGPNPERDGVSAWTARDLCQIALDRFGVRLQREWHARSAARAQPLLAEDPARASASRSQGPNGI